MVTIFENLDENCPRDQVFPSVGNDRSLWRFCGTTWEGRCFLEQNIEIATASSLSALDSAQLLQILQYAIRFIPMLDSFFLHEAVYDKQSVAFCSV